MYASVAAASTYSYIVYLSYGHLLLVQDTSSSACACTGPGLPHPVNIELPNFEPFLHYLFVQLNDDNGNIIDVFCRPDSLRCMKLHKRQGNASEYPETWRK